jgi:hypothetical protein
VALSTISLTLISETTFYFTDQRRMKGYQYYVISLVLFVTLIFAQRPRYKDDYYNKRTNKKKKSDKPNINWWRKPEYPEKTTDVLPQVTDKLYYIM